MRQEIQAVIDYYDRNAVDLAKRYAAQSPETLHTKLIEILDKEKPEGDIFEIGAGMGRDAMFFGQRYKSNVMGIESSKNLMNQMSSTLQSNGYEIGGATALDIEPAVWYVKDDLEIYVRRGTLGSLADEWNNAKSQTDESELPHYAFINVNAVWQHVPLQERVQDAAVLTDMLCAGGIISIKGRNKVTQEQEGIAWETTIDELREQFKDLEEILIEEQPDHSKPGSDMTFISGIWRKPVYA